MGDAGLEGLDEKRGEVLLVFFGDLEDFAGCLQRFFTLRIPDLGEDDIGDSGSIEAELDGHGGAEGRKGMGFAKD